MDAARTWCPSAGCDTICHICAGTKSQVALNYDAIDMDHIHNNVKLKNHIWTQGVPVSCPTCDKEFCSLCSATWHPGLSCAEHGAALVRNHHRHHHHHHHHHHHDHQVKRGGEPVDPFFLPDNCNDNIKRCPMCSVPIERDAGCAQVIGWRERSTLIWWLFR